MNIDEFVDSYPELHNMLTRHVRRFIMDNNITGDTPLRDWDGMVEEILGMGDGYDYDDYGNALPAIAPATYRNHGMERRSFDPPVGRRSMRGFDERRDRFDRFDRFHDRRFRRFDLRDIVRLIFLKELFDRDRGRR